MKMPGHRGWGSCVSAFPNHKTRCCLRVCCFGAAGTGPMSTAGREQPGPGGAGPAAPRAVETRKASRVVLMEGPAGCSGRSQKALFTPAGFIFPQPAWSKSTAVGPAYRVSLCSARAALSRHPLRCPLTAHLHDNYFRWSQRESKPFLLKMTELTTKPSCQTCPAVPSLSRCPVQQMPRAQKPGGRTCQPCLGAPSEPSSEGHPAHGTTSSSGQHPHERGTHSQLRAKCILYVRAKPTRRHALCRSCCPAPPSSAEPSRECKDKITTTSEVLQAALPRLVQRRCCCSSRRAGWFPLPVILTRPPLLCGAGSPRRLPAGSSSRMHHAPGAKPEEKKKITQRLRTEPSEEDPASRDCSTGDNRRLLRRLNISS